MIQCCIVTFVFWPRAAAVNYSSAKALAPFTSSAIDELKISDEFDNETVLVRSGTQWLIPNLENLPADSTRVNSFLDTISAFDASWPIGQSASARQRFQVSRHFYQRRLSLMSEGAKLGTIYLGTSPGFRKVHARRENQDEIYSIGLSNFEVPAVDGGWLDPKLLQIRSPLGIDADLYSLRYEDGLWLSGGGGSPVMEEVETLTTALRTVQVEGVADRDTQRSLAALEPELILKIQSLTGEKTLELSTLGNEHFIYSSEYLQFFKLSIYDFDRLTGIDISLISGEGNGQ
jgi:hypothetical protein